MERKIFPKNQFFYDMIANFQTMQKTVRDCEKTSQPLNKQKDLFYSVRANFECFQVQIDELLLYILSNDIFPVNIVKTHQLHQRA